MERNCYKKTTLEILTTMKLEMTYIHYQILVSSSFDCFFKDKFILKSHILAPFHLEQESKYFSYSYTLPMPKILAKCDFIPEIFNHSSPQHSDVLITWHFCLNSCKCVCWLSNQRFGYSSQGWLPLIFHHKLKCNLF